MRTEPVEFKVEGQILRGNIYFAIKPKKLALLFLHGWTGKPNNNAAKVMAENGFNCMAFSLSGHNDSDGKIEDQTRQKSLKEVVAAYDYFKERLLEGAKIVAVGNSYGGYLAPVLSSGRELAAVSMRVPANYPDKGFSNAHQIETSKSSFVMEWRKQKVGSSETKSLRALHRFKGPIQIIEAEHDDAIPHQTVMNYVEAVPNEGQLKYDFMKGWPHSLGDHETCNKQFQKVLLNWAEKVEEKL